MRRPVLALTVAGALVAAATASSAVVPVLVPSTPVTNPIASSNVTHVGTVPLDGVGVSLEVRQVGDQVRAFASGAGGLSIYDATDPTAPTLLGHLPIYNFENEDMAVSKDGKTAFLTESTANAYLHAVDVPNPLVPVITDTIVGAGPHTVVCADDPCGYLYGSNGRIFDVRDRADISALPTSANWTAQLGVPGGHNVHEDGAGYFVSDTTPLVMSEQVDGDPLKVSELTDGRISKNTAYQHNNIRPNADQWQPRGADEGLGGPLRPGELLLGNGETNFTRTCGGGSGAFSTWSMAGWNEGVPMQQLEVLRPVSGSFTDGGPAINQLGCSGHCFTERDSLDGQILVAAGWYEHGTRFIKVDPTNGGIRQLSFFQPVRGSTSEAFLMPDADPEDGKHVVWSIDLHSGIDVLVFDENAPVPTTAQIDASWLAKEDVVDLQAVLSRELCRAGDSATQEQHDRMHTATSELLAAKGVGPTFASLTGS